MDDMDEIVKNINQQNRDETTETVKTLNNKRDRTSEETSLRKNKNLKTRLNETTLEENTEEEQDDEVKDVLSSTPNPGCMLNLKSHSTGSKNISRPREIMHYFSVPDTPCGTVQPRGRKCQDIPETPELEEKMSNVHEKDDASFKEKQKNKKNSKRKNKIENVEDDNELIKELFEKTEEQTYHNE